MSLAANRLQSLFPLSVVVGTIVEKAHTTTRLMRSNATQMVDVGWHSFAQWACWYHENVGLSMLHQMLEV